MGQTGTAQTHPCHGLSLSASLTRLCLAAGCGQNWSILRPFVTMSEPELAELRAAGVYVAGFMDPAIAERTDLYDLLVDLDNNAITVPTHAKGEQAGRQAGWARAVCALGQTRPCGGGGPPACWPSLTAVTPPAGGGHGDGAVARGPPHGFAAQGRGGAHGGGRRGEDRPGGEGGGDSRQPPLGGEGGVADCRASSMGQTETWAGAGCGVQVIKAVAIKTLEVVKQLRASFGGGSARELIERVEVGKRQRVLTGGEGARCWLARQRRRREGGAESALLALLMGGWTGSPVTLRPPPYCCMYCASCCSCLQASDIPVTMRRFVVNVGLAEGFTSQ